MSTPIDPNDTLALRAVIANAMEYGLDALTLKRAAYDYAANAVARAVCPEGCVVVSRDDLRAQLMGIESEIEDREAATDRLWSALEDQP